MPATILTFPPNPTVVSAHNDGGPHFSFPEVNLIFWGKAWSADPPPTPTAHTITSAIRSIVNSDFLGELAQYGVVGQPMVVTTDVAAAAIRTGQLRLQPRELHQVAHRGWQGARRQPPTYQSFYGVIVPPGVKSTETRTPPVPTAPSSMVASTARRLGS